MAVHLGAVHSVKQRACRRTQWVTLIWPPLPASIQSQTLWFSPICQHAAFTVDDVRQHSALILPKAFNALSGKYQFLGKMIYWLSCTSLELRDFNTHKVSFEMRGKRFSVPVLVSGRGQPRIQMQVEQSKRKEFGEEGSGKRTAGLFCRKQSAAKWLTCPCVKVHSLIKEKEAVARDCWIWDGAVRCQTCTCFTHGWSAGEHAQMQTHVDTSSRGKWVTLTRSVSLAVVLYRSLAVSHYTHTHKCICIHNACTKRKKGIPTPTYLHINTLILSSSAQTKTSEHLWADVCAVFQTRGVVAASRTPWQQEVEKNKQNKWAIYIALMKLSLVQFYLHSTFDSKNCL